MIKKAFLAVMLCLCLSCCSTPDFPDLLKNDAPDWVLYAPNQQQLDRHSVSLERATAVMAKLLGEKAPKIAVLLFPDNKALVGFDYSNFRQKTLSYLPWLCDQGLYADAPWSRGECEYHSHTITEWKVYLINKQQPRPFITVGSSRKDSTLTPEKMITDRPRLVHGDKIVALNGQSVTTICELLKTYDQIARGSVVKMAIERAGKKGCLTFIHKELKSDGSARIADENPVSHEAGHLFLIAYTEKRRQALTGEKPRLFFDLSDSARLSYGHPQLADWLDESAAVLCEPPEQLYGRLQGARRMLDRMAPLSTLVTQSRTVLSTKFNGVKRIISESHATETDLFYQAAPAFLLYLWEKEGASFIRQLVDDDLGDVPFAKTIEARRNLPGTVTEMEKDFHQWLKQGRSTGF